MASARRAPTAQTPTSSVRSPTTSSQTPTASAQRASTGRTSTSSVLSFFPEDRSQAVPKNTVKRIMSEGGPRTSLRVRPGVRESMEPRSSLKARVQKQAKDDDPEARARGSLVSIDQQLED
mmetsp:Transcript_52468/g.118501  ORF Transcript_52468/g.118501 Transcript_52468/m.118501 type:complete len:121 (-) Transcript_52468:124-486(-)